jgi:predicted alpha/beta superfamily hydrolase
LARWNQILFLTIMNRRSLVLIVLLLSYSSMFAQVTFLVQQIPTNTPPSDTLYIAGSFQGWDPANHAFKLINQGNGSYVLTTPVTGSIQYKYTRGSWASVEGNSNGTFRPNRAVSVSAGDTIRDTILSWEDLGGSSGNSTAQPNVTRITGFHMTALNRNRAVLVYVPLDYQSSQKNYPVFYMHDGQNVFDAATSFAGEWEVDETLNNLRQDSNDFGCIVVAIENSADRIDELTPYSHPQYGGGDGDKYVQFIMQDLKPWIDSAYRTLPGAEFTAIGGSSLGGLLSFYAQQTYPQVFGKALVFSPSYWFNDSVYKLPSNNGALSSSRVFQLAGGQESGGSVVQAVNRMADSLLMNGINPSDLRTSVKNDGQHSEWFWRREFSEAYRWLFKNTSMQVQEKTIERRAPYPNPVGDYMSILPCKECKALVFDTAGRLIADFSALLSTSSIEPAERVTLEGLNKLLQPGFYYLRVSNASSVTVYPFEKR